MALAGAEWGSCFGRLIGQPALAAPFTLSNGARDLRFLIEQGDRAKPVWVYAVSYGTQLVLRALQIGPLPVRGVILDSLVPLQTDARFDLSQRAKLVDATGRQLLHDCDADTACHALLREPGEEVLKRVLVKGETTPALLAAIPGNNLKRFLGGALDVPAARALMPRLISELDADADTAGNALPRMLAALREAGAALGDYPQSPPSIPLVSIISAAENSLRPDLSATLLKDEESTLLFSSRLPELLVAPSLPIYRRDALFGGVPARLPPLLVLSGTRDPKTAYAGAQDHVAALRKAGPVRHITVQGAPHFILWTAPDCLVASIRAFVAGARSGDASCTLATRFD
jgi:pimeloyl-ACP methyl ester carboxylesterase